MARPKKDTDDTSDDGTEAPYEVSEARAAFFRGEISWAELCTAEGVLP